MRVGIFVCDPLQFIRIYLALVPDIPVGPCSPRPWNGVNALDDRRCPDLFLPAGPAECLPAPGAQYALRYPGLIAVRVCAAVDHLRPQALVPEGMMRACPAYPKNPSWRKRVAIWLVVLLRSMV